MMVAVASEGIVKEVVLPDGSKVWLNNAATLKYPREFSEKERNVYLEGEAYFEVTHHENKPFILRSPKTAISHSPFKVMQYAYAYWELRSI